MYARSLCAERGAPPLAQHTRNLPYVKRTLRGTSLAERLAADTVSKCHHWGASDPQRFLVLLSMHLIVVDIVQGTTPGTTVVRAVRTV